MVLKLLIYVLTVLGPSKKNAFGRSLHAIPLYAHGPFFFHFGSKSNPPLAFISNGAKKSCTLNPVAKIRTSGFTVVPSSFMMVSSVTSLIGFVMTCTLGLANEG